jgi:hypothetical protein
MTDGIASAIISFVYNRPLDRCLHNQLSQNQYAVLHVVHFVQRTIAGADLRHPQPAASTQGYDLDAMDGLGRE